MISKNKFVQIIENLKQVNDFVDEVNNKARKLNDAIISDFFNASSLSISHEDTVIYLLKNIFCDTANVLSWWIYELDYGRKYKDGVMQDANCNNIDLSTTEKLYDYLIEEMEETI